MPAKQFAQEANGLTTIKKGSTWGRLPNVRIEDSAELIVVFDHEKRTHQ